jgi:IclR family pca regulon transcriptional regulator
MSRQADAGTGLVNSGSGSATRGRSEHVQSLERGLAVLRAFREPGSALTISEVAERTDLSRATARRILLTLHELGYVAVDRREFSLTSAVLDLAKPFVASNDPWEFTRPYLQSLTDRLGESASVAVLDGTEILYVARTPTRRLMTLAVAVGSRLPAHATSKGRVLLAFLPDAELEAYFAQSAIARYTDKTVVDEQELRGILTEVRVQGWAIVDQQLEEGLCSVAAPISDGNGRVGAALSVCAHAGRVDSATLRGEFLPLILETARRVSAVWSRR